MIDNYNQYLKRYGLKDLINLWHQCRFESSTKFFILTVDQVNNELDRLFLDYLFEISTECGVNDEMSTETKENLVKLFDKEKKSPKQGISKVSVFA